MAPRCHFGAFVYTVGLLRCRGQTWGRNSVHKSPKMAYRCRFGEFVYIVGLLRTDMGTQECTQIGQNGLSAPFWGICVHCCASRGSCERRWGRRSVHKWEDRASPRRFGAFVYTVATRVAIRIATRAVPGGTSASATTACRRRPLAGPSRLVGKTGSARAAPLPGWHLRRGVNPHEPLKSTKKMGQRTMALARERLWWTGRGSNPGPWD